MWRQTVRTCRLTPDRSEVNFFGGQLMSAKNLSHSLAQGTAVLRQRSKWLQGDIKAELDEILKSSEFRYLILAKSIKWDIYSTKDVSSVTVYCHASSAGRRAISPRYSLRKSLLRRSMSEVRRYWSRTVWAPTAYRRGRKHAEEMDWTAATSRKLPKSCRGSKSGFASVW